MKSLLAIPLISLALFSSGAFAADARLISFGDFGCHYDDGSVVFLRMGSVHTK